MSKGSFARDPDSFTVNKSKIVNIKNTKSTLKKSSYMKAWTSSRNKYEKHKYSKNFDSFAKNLMSQMKKKNLKVSKNSKNKGSRTRRTRRTRRSQDSRLF